MIDMDDVICEGGFIYQLNKFLGTNYTTKDMKGYYMQELIPKEKIEEWNEYVCSKNLYKDGNIFIEGALETIEALSKEYEVYIVTAFIWPQAPTKAAKHLIKCDVKIDDKLSNILENTETKLLFDAYHNRDITNEELEKLGVKRVCTWRDIRALLLK